MTEPAQHTMMHVTASVGRARLLAGATRFKLSTLPNVSDTYRGQILTSEGVRPAIIKDLPVRELANEVFAAALGSFLSLPIPPAYLTLATKDVFTANHAPDMDGAALLFASTDVATPPVAQYVVGNVDAVAALRAVAAELLKRTGVGEFYAFDAWTANVDRNVGNVLVGGSETAWLIDHGRCFTGPDWEQRDLLADGAFRNRLQEWLTPYLKLDERTRCAAEATATVDRLPAASVRRIGEANGVPRLLGENDFDALVTFLSDRVQHVQRLAVQALDMVA